MLTAGDPAGGEDRAAAGRHPLPARRLRGRVPRGGDEAAQVQDALPGWQGWYTTAGHVFLFLVQAALGQDAEFLAESLFRVFDDDKSGSMDFQEYIMALNATRLVCFF